MEVNGVSRRRKEMLMWAKLMLPLSEVLSWLYLLEWAELGGSPHDFRHRFASDER